MTKNKIIGVYDSGVGGLTVLKELVSLMPNEEYAYFGDLKNLPYGEKTKDELLCIGKKIFDFFLDMDVKAVVMACNTTSALIYDEIKTKYPFKIYPVIQNIAKSFAKTNIEKLGVLATPATINSHAYKKEIYKHNKNLQIFEQACPSWVKIVENRDYNSKNIEIIENDLKKMLQNNPQKIILGCTHYPYLTDILSKYAPKEIFINPAKKLAEIIKENMIKEGLLSDKNLFKQIFYVSDNPKKFEESSKLFYPIKSHPILKKL